MRWYRWWYSEEALQKLAVIAKEEQVNEIIVESNFGDGMFNQLFMPSAEQGSFGYYE